MHIAKIDIYLHTRPQSSPLADTLLQYQNSLLFTTIHFFIVIRSELPDDHVKNMLSECSRWAHCCRNWKSMYGSDWISLLVIADHLFYEQIEIEQSVDECICNNTSICHKVMWLWAGKKNCSIFTCSYEVCTCIITPLWVCCGCDLSWLLFSSWPAAGLLLEATW